MRAATPNTVGVREIKDSDILIYDHVSARWTTRLAPRNIILHTKLDCVDT